MFYSGKNAFQLIPGVHVWWSDLEILMYNYIITIKGSLVFTQFGFEHTYTFMYLQSCSWDSIALGNCCHGNLGQAAPPVHIP